MVQEEGDLDKDDIRGLMRSRRIQETFWTWNNLMSDLGSLCMVYLYQIIIENWQYLSSTYYIRGTGSYRRQTPTPTCPTAIGSSKLGKLLPILTPPHFQGQRHTLHPPALYSNAELRLMVSEENWCHKKRSPKFSQHLRVKTRGAQSFNIGEMVQQGLKDERNLLVPTQLSIFFWACQSFS